MAEKAKGNLIPLPSGERVYAEKHDRTSNVGPDIPLLFIHGFIMTSDSWQSILPSFPQYTRIVFDTAMHGRTGVTGVPVTMDSLAQEVNDVLTYFGYDKAVIIGHSAGSTIAVHFAGTYPSKVHKLIIVTPLLIPPPDDWAHRTQLVSTLGTKTLCDIHISFMGEEARNDPQKRALIERDFELHADRWVGLAEYFSALGDVAFRGTGDAVETWLISGTEDSASPQETITAVADLTGAKVIALQQGHYVMFEDVAATIDVLQNILGE